jgi:hypothetical protein
MCVRLLLALTQKTGDRSVTCAGDAGGTLVTLLWFPTAVVVAVGVTAWHGMTVSESDNNEFLVVDYKLFKPNSVPPANTLWILDQVPGYVESQDVTPLLISQGYFASYNIPFNPYVCVCAVTRVLRCVCIAISFLRRSC